MKKEFTVIIEQDEDGVFIADVPELRGCHTQASSLDELMTIVHEAIEFCLEVTDYDISQTHFEGIQKISI